MFSDRDRKLGCYFDGLATRGLWEDFEPAELVQVRTFLALLDLRPGQRVCEPGCGAGRLTALLAEEVGVDGEVFAFDLSAEMVRRGHGRGLPPHVTVACAAATDLPQPDGYFDVVVCFNVFPHFSDRAQSLCELARVLKDDGRFWIAHSKGRETINATHRRGPPEIREHLIPCLKSIAEALAGSGLEAVDGVDCADRFWVHARKSPQQD